MTYGDLVDDEQVSLLHEYSCGVLFGEVAGSLSLDVDRDLAAPVEGLSIVQ